jgi:L-ascorbate metabolism protein UlaG (beta-lactamase superfamily)
MRLTILGTRGNIAPSSLHYARHSGILVDGRILLDLGEITYLRYRPHQIFISHLHPDHAAFPRNRLPIDAEIYLPEPAGALPNARVVSRAVQSGSYRILAVPTVHSPRVRSLGYIIEHGGRRVFYSSDLVTIEPKYHRRLGRLDLVITDGSSMRKGGLVRIDSASGRPFGHAGIPELVEFFSRFTSRIVLTHFGSWFYRDIPASIRRIAALSGRGRGRGRATVSAARDGMVLRV